jgi:hypothetical protein
MRDKRRPNSRCNAANAVNIVSSLFGSTCVNSSGEGSLAVWLGNASLARGRC